MLVNRQSKQTSMVQINGYITWKQFPIQQHKIPSNRQKANPINVWQQKNSKREGKICEKL